jgi:anti-anti-sigma factor
MTNERHHVSSERIGESIILRVAGEMNEEVAKEFLKAVDLAVNDRPKTLLIDLKNVLAIGSRGLGVMVHAFVRREHPDISIMFVRPTGQVANAMRMTNLHRLYPFYNSAEEGLRDT